MNISKFLLTLLCALALFGASSFGSPLADSQSSPKANFYSFTNGQDQAAVESSPAPQLVSSEPMSAAKHTEDAALQISLANPEFRLIGAQQTPVRMNDDIETRLMVAVDNLRKDAADLWGSVSSTLEKTWNNARFSIEREYSDARTTAKQGWTEVNKGLNVAGSKLDKTWTDLRALVEKQVASVKKGSTSEVPQFFEQFNN